MQGVGFNEIKLKSHVVRYRIYDAETMIKENQRDYNTV